MLENIRSYFKNCAKLAWKDSIDSALTWSGILGIAVMGDYYKYKGQNMTLPSDWIPAVIVTIETAVITWIIIFLCRMFLFSPFRLWVASGEKIGALENKAEREANKAKLQALYESGIILRNNHTRAQVKCEEDWKKKWSPAHNKWVSETRDAAKPISNDLYTLFWNVNKVNFSEIPAFQNTAYASDGEDFAFQYGSMCKRVDLLEDFFKKEYLVQQI